MSARREIEFPWEDGQTILSRPTLLKMSQVEQKFGAALRLVDRLGRSELSTTGELLPLLAVMLRGCDGAPKADAKIIETAYELGPVRFVVPMIDWIVAGHTVDTPADPSTTSGN